jgi:hypothetical protein
VSFDFKALRAPRLANTLTDPRVLFDALPNRRPPFDEFLRDPQGQVLDAWYARRNETDLVIKLNTGGGKTVIGLLVCQSSLNERVGPALYLASDPYLAEQAADQARALGLDVTNDPESTAFASGQAICIVSIYRLVNGKSVFGIEGGYRPVKEVGTIVIDDVHAAIATTDAQFTLALPASHPVYSELLTLFEDDLRGQSASTLLDIQARVPSAVLRVPFWAWARKIEEVTEKLHAARDDDDVQWAWPLICDVLPVCHAVFTSDALEIRPPCPPIDKIPSFLAARRRIYMTATLADDSVLVTDFDADPATVEHPITPASGGYLGDRLILAPQEISPQIQEHEIREAVREFANRRNVVVLVPSHRRAGLWREYADVTASDSPGIAAAVARLRSGHVGLAVLVNKYDGIDLPDDACRILVLDGLPEAYSGLERRDAAVLGSSKALFDRQLQRIEQGMGRGVRSTNDHCVVLLLGSRLSQLIASPQSFAKLGPATRAQAELSRQVATALEGRDIDALTGVMEQVLERDSDWLATARATLAEVTFSGGTVSPVAAASREAFNHAAVGQYAAAVHSMSNAVNAAVDDRQRGYLQEQLAAYQHFTDASAAQTTLAGALKFNRSITRPLQGVTYDRLRSGATQAAQAANYLSSTYVDANSLLLGIDALFDDLSFDPARISEFETAVEELGRHLGFTAQRPERDSGNGPDVLWALGDLRYLVIEAKSGATGDVIWRHDVAQLGHSMNWFAANYDASCRAAPVLIHPASIVAKNATAPPGTRVITEAKLAALQAKVRAMMVALVGANAWGDVDVVAEQLRAHQFRGPELLSNYSATARSQK